MRDIIRTGLLFDFYEKLLTERQRTVMGLYLNEDFSLAEISEEIDISRQGVHDIIKRTSRKLEDFEAKLGLSRRLGENRRLGEEIKAELESKGIKELSKKIDRMVEG